MQKYGISQGLLNCCYTVKYPTECKKQSPQLIVPTDGSHSGVTQTGGEDRVNCYRHALIAHERPKEVATAPASNCA